MDTITVLRSCGKASLRKHFKDGKDQNSKPLVSEWTAERVPVESLSDIQCLLEILADDPEACIVRGDPAVEGTPIVRNNHTIQDCPRHWVVLDIDGTTGSTLEDALAGLPDVFKGAEVLRKASGSSGIKPGLRMHLWFWFKEPVTCAELHKSLGKVTNVDPTLFNPSHILYTCDPLLENTPDPYEGKSRFTYMEGDAVSHLPDPPSEPTEMDRIEGHEKAERALDAVCKEVKKAGVGERHDLMHRKAYGFWYKYRASWQGGRDAAFDRIVRAELTGSQPRPEEEIRTDLAETFRVAEKQSGAEKGRLALKRGESGVVLSTPANCMLLVQEGLSEYLAYNIRTGKIEFAGQPKGWPAMVHAGDELEDVHISQLAIWLHHLEPKAPMAFGKDARFEALLNAGYNNPFDEVVDYLEGLPEWDGRSRVDDLLGIIGAEIDTPHRAMMGKWLISAVARAMQPGCQADSMVVFQGGQGIGKSSFFRELFGEKFYGCGGADASIGKDFFLRVRHLWCYEFDEMGILKGKDRERVKSLISTQRDDMRDPYARTSKSWPRRYVFAGTTNSPAFLDDDTGSRRIWPIKCGEAVFDLKILRLMRDQVWAEALALYQAGEKWYLEDAEVLVDVHERFAIGSPIWEAMKTYLNLPAPNKKVSALPLGVATVVPQEYAWCFKNGVRVYTSVDELHEALSDEGPLKRKGWVRQNLSELLEKHGFKATRPSVEGVRIRCYAVPEGDKALNDKMEER